MQLQYQCSNKGDQSKGDMINKHNLKNNSVHLIGKFGKSKSILKPLIVLGIITHCIVILPFYNQPL